MRVNCSRHNLVSQMIAKLGKGLGEAKLPVAIIRQAAWFVGITC